MTVVLLPLPDGIPGEEAERLQQIIHAIRGFKGQGIAFNLTTYNHAEQYALSARNQNTAGGGLHLACYLSSSTLPGATPIFEVQDAGVFIDVATTIRAATTVTANLTVNGSVGIGNALSVANEVGIGGALTVTGDVLVGDTLFVDEGIDVIGGGIISGAVTFTNQIISTLANGTAPFSITSQTLVTNLNADMVDGLHAAAFSLAGHTHDTSHNHDNDYINEGGDTTSGDYTFLGSIDVNGSLSVNTNLDVDGTSAFGNIVQIAAPSDYALQIRNSTSPNLGYWKIGTTTTASPNFRIYDPSDVEMLDITDAGILQFAAAEISGTLDVVGAVNTDSDTVFGSASTDTHEFWGSVTVRHNFRLREAHDGAGINTSTTNSNGRIFIEVWDGSSWVEKSIPYYN